MMGASRSQGTLHGLNSKGETRVHNLNAIAAPTGLLHLTCSARRHSHFLPIYETNIIAITRRAHTTRTHQRRGERGITTPEKQQLTTHGDLTAIWSAGETPSERQRRNSAARLYWTDDDDNNLTRAIRFHT